MTFKNVSRATVAALAACFFTAQPAIAGTATANLDVLATVDPACRVTTTPVDFGTIDPTANVNFRATGSLNVTCTSGTPWSAQADKGANFLQIDANNWLRRLKTQTSATSSYLTYYLFVDSAELLLWNRLPNLSEFSGTGTGSVDSRVIYAKIPPNQTTAPVDSYKDTVQVTVTY